ncbi:Maf family protein [Stakelama tenebrarum]|uniref:Nucleoside triphosphate pyrophosphatase n=1 Tax=Stakelama tenebrarum TaxID=2711215 RepID=A0A6G6Y1E1_9SPHN|nr:nucleoside triphosphate pyrophosphatase [Sphingosinithalassobacter tenebrarum]QIG78538.1 septum formation protein Maf [Sphingosinithalassobacter tenebrarum]
MTLVLASQSASRRAMLDAAGVPHEAVVAQVDEESATESLVADGIAPRDLADALAELKACKVSRLAPTALVLGCDSVVALEDGTLLEKPKSRDHAADQLRAMSGRHHDLFSAAVISEGGRPIWRHVDRARLHVRTLGEDFIAAYLDAEWPEIQWCVGGYRLEAVGAQLFSRIDGSHFTILGMPLLPLLDFLRVRKVIAT